MDRKHIRILFERLDNGTINRTEYDELMDYLAGDESGQIELPEEVLDGKEVGLTDADIRRAFDKVGARLEVSQNRKARALWRPLTAASIAAIILAGILLFWESNTQRYRLPVMVGGVFTKEVPFGIRDSLTLPDGSKVWMNSGTKLSYPTAYAADGKRTITLHGEAFFDVVPIADTPFVVKTGEVSTTVLGTSFNVNAFDAGCLTVTVAHGKVSVATPRQDLALLTINQRVIYDNEDRRATVSEVDAREARAWIEDKLVFRDVSVAQAVAVMSRRFDIAFRFTSPALANCRFSASFDPGESLDNVLRVVGLANGMAYSKEGSLVVLSGEGCP